MLSSSERQALLHADRLSRQPDVPPGPNPKVGCVLLDATGGVISTGYHRGAGTPHAEAMALAVAGSLAQGATAVVTLEPCNHTGRTGPCAQALIEAGVARVVYAVCDPGAESAGGAQTLQAAGIETVYAQKEADAAPEVAQVFKHLRPWWLAVQRGRPFVTLKTASTMDGRVAASDGTSRWITGASARAQVHQMRGDVGAVIVGTNTAAVDNPSLTARAGDDSLLPHQPLRVVVGHRDLPAQALLHQAIPGAGELLHYRTHDVGEVLTDLHGRSVRHVLVEGGPTLSAAFLRAGFVDRWVSYVAPVILGEGSSVVGDLSISTMAQALRWRVVDVEQVGEDARISVEPATDDEPGD